MRECGYPASRLKPTKGYHFLDGPYVEYVIEEGQEALSAEEMKVRESESLWKLSLWVIMLYDSCTIAVR
jgi:hypothetical protein